VIQAAWRFPLSLIALVGGMKSRAARALAAFPAIVIAEAGRQTQSSQQDMTPSG
jgi:hypothetical protein